MTQTVYTGRDFEKPVWVLGKEGAIVKAEKVTRFDEIDEYRVSYYIDTRMYHNTTEFVRRHCVNEEYVSENGDRLVFDITPEIIKAAQTILQTNMDSYTEEFERAKRKYETAKAIYNMRLESFEALRLGIEPNEHKYVGMPCGELG